MTATTPTHVDSSIPEVWAKRVFADTLRDGFWGKFVGDVGQGLPIVQQTELLNKPGDLIHIQTTGPLAGAGVTGDTATLQGNEENLTTSEMKVAPLLYRHGVLINRRASKKSILDLREEARNRLSEWGKEKVDDKRFAQFTSITNSDIPENTGYDQPNTYTVGGGFNTGAAAGNFGSAAIAAGEKLSVAEIRKIRYHLQNQNARPWKVAGVPWYGLIISPEQEYDLKTDSAYLNNLQLAANRGMDNPVFTGAIAAVEGMVLYSHFNVPTGTNAGPVRYAVGLAFGAEAFVEGWDEDVQWKEDTFDYEHQWGVGYSFAFQCRRALEKSSMLVYAAATQPS